MRDATTPAEAGRTADEADTPESEDRTSARATESASMAPAPAAAPGGPSHPTPSLPAILDRRWLAVAAAVMTAAAILVALAMPPGWSGPSAGPNAPTARPEPSAAVAEAGWTALSLPVAARIADLVPLTRDRAGVAVKSRFRLTSVGDADARTLAEGLTAVPAVTFRVASGSTARSAILVPAQPLDEGIRYRIALRVAGQVVGSWQFATRQPLRMSESIPTDQTTDVPVDTGIELTFNQDGVAPIESYFSIRPAVAGTFERHGRAWVFVPEPLVPATIYTVTLKKGVPVTGTDLTLEDDVRFSFETAPPGAPKPSAGTTRDRPLPPLRILFPREVVEVVPGERPVLDLWVEPPGSHDTRPVTTTVDLRVFSLPDVATATAAVTRLLRANDWAAWSDAGLVATKGLPLAATFRAPIRTLGEDSDARDYVEFPGVLAPGWYLVVRPSAGRDAQLVLQVTDVATNVTLTSTRSVVWVNDVAAGGAMADAAIRTVDGRILGRTDAEGIARLKLDGSTTLLVTAADAGEPGPGLIPGRAAIVPLEGSSAWAGVAFSDVSYSGWSPDDRAYWHVLYTDRSLFRSTDEIDAWGLVRARNGGAIPASVRVRLVAAEWSSFDPTGLKLPDVVATPDTRTGAFTARLPIADLPAGQYFVQTRIGSKSIGSRYIEVGVIAKPAYRLEIALAPHAVVEGEPVTATIHASFFDGTPVPGLELRVGGLQGVSTARTGDDGRVTVTALASWDHSDRDAPRNEAVTVHPAGGEETDISAAARYVVLPSRSVVSGDATLSGSTLVVSARVASLDLAAADRAAVADAPVDAVWSGPPAAGASVRILVTDEWDVRVKTGRRYDPIMKRAYDTYRYEAREAVLRDVTVPTSSDGSLRVGVPVAAVGGVLPDGHDYEVVLTTADGQGRTMMVRRFASAPSRLGTPAWSDAQAATLPFELGAALHDTTYAVGAPIRLPLTYGGAAPATGGPNRFLFISAHDGLRSVKASTMPVYETTFGTADLPSMVVTAAWFTGRTYVTATGYEAYVDTTDRSLRLEVVPDRATYEPGDDAAVTVRATDAAGRPVAATIVLRAVDEKLYAIGAAHPGAALDALYQRVESGLGASYSSHPSPRTTLRRGAWEWREGYGDTCGCGGQGGDTAGGGSAIRDDFRDVVLFRTVRTGASGVARVTFHLADDVTSWRVSAAAFSASLEVGETALSMPVGLPLFIEAPVAAEYVATDRPVLRLRAYGTQLQAGQPVTFTVSAPTLGMRTTTIRGIAFTGVDVQLPTLTTGDHRVRIAVSAGSGATRSSDALMRTLHVVASRLTQQRSSYSLLTTSIPKPSAVGTVTYTFLDGGRGKYLADLRELADGWSERLDVQLVASIASGLLADEFGLDRLAPPFALERFTRPLSGDDSSAEGLALLTYGSPDLDLTARVALVQPDQVDSWTVEEYLRGVRDGASSTREERLIALAALASLGREIAEDVEAAAAATDLTVREKLYVALAAAHAGDYSTARSLERELLARYGQRLGPWVRLSLGDAAVNAEASALLTLLALELGDPIAAATEAFVEENPSPDDLAVLQRLAFVRRMMEVAPATTARFEYRLAGSRHVVTLAAGESVRVEVPRWQAASFSARRLAGSVGVSVSWVSATTAGKLPRDPSLALDRTTVPSTPVPLGSVVTVVLMPRFGDFVMTGCYRVEDIVPSGLAPVAGSDGGLPRGEDDDAPVAIDGQRVSFCAIPSSPQHRLVYYARVVAPGDYAWEPATMRSERALENGTNTGITRLAVR